MTPSKWRYRMLPLATLLLAACHSSSPVSGAADPDAAPGTRCDNPAPPGTMEASIEVDVPSDTDATANPTPTTRIPLTVHLPRRCPGERFPLILYGHGFSESRGSVNSGLIDDGNMQPLLERGYVAIKFDQRGHGDNRPPLGGGYSRLMDPAVETQDARAILDWAWEHAAEIHVQTEPGSGVAKDLRVGTLGASYGGGFQLQLVALDSRIDVIAPDRTWHSLLHSVLPGDVLKTMARLLTLFIQLDQLVPGQGVTTTPLMQSFANQVGPLAPTANLVRTREELAAALERPTTLPRPVSEEEAIEFVQTHAPDYFQARELAGQPWGFGAPQSRLRPVPALFTQGQRDVLFSATEAYRNASWFEAAGAEVRVITHEDGHQNPLAGQTRGVWACGTVNAQEAILAWLDRWLKGRDSAAFRAIPKVCISVLDSGDPQATPVGVALERFPVGSLDGQGAVPLRVPTVSATVGPADADGLFLPLATIAGEGRVLAGIPRVGQVTVTRGIGTLQAAIAIVGIGLRRDGAVHLVNDQVTSFVEGEHDHNRGVLSSDELLLPGVGQRLQDGDELGLLFYGQHVQFAPLLAGQNLGGLPTIIPGFPVALPQPLVSALDPLLGLVNPPNTYDITLIDVELPVLVPGEYPGSRLLQQGSGTEEGQ